MPPLIQKLAADTENPCVSLYLPILPGAKHTVSNVERLHRMLGDIEPQLLRYGIEGKAQSQFLGAAHGFADETLSQGIGAGTLAMFLSPSLFEVRQLPIDMQERAVVGRRFHITPFLPFLYSALHYYVLAISAKSAHFLEVEDGELEAKEIPDMPRSIEEAWAGMEHTGESLSFHSTGNGSVGFSGHSNAKDDKENELMVYLQKIAKSLHTLLHEHDVPLVFAGVAELHGIYKSLDTSGKLLEDFIKGNPDRLEAKAMMDKAEPIVTAAIQLRQQHLLDGYANIAGTGKTSTDLALVLDAAAIGKVDLLFVAEGSEQWGTFDQESGRKELHEGLTVGDEELLGLCALHTLRHKGRVVALPLKNMPEGAQVAAILRY